MTDLKRVATALKRAEEAGDDYAVQQLGALLHRSVAERRDELLTHLEALFDQVEAAERRDNRSVADAAFIRFESALRGYERLCDAIRAHPHLPDALTVAGVGAQKETS